MARVTVEDCLDRVGNHFALVILAAERARQIYQESYSSATSEHRPTVTALKEIAEGKVHFADSIQNHLEQYLHELRIRGLESSGRPYHELSSSSES